VTRRFPIRYTPIKGALLRLFLVLQRWSYVDVRPDVVAVRMSYGFAVEFARSNVAHVSRERRVPVTTGAHGWRGRWLVNGASGPIVAVKLRDPVRGRVVGFPVEVREVQVSVAEADELVSLLAG
jgi:hypothetical protein